MSQSRPDLWRREFDGRGAARRALLEDEPQVTLKLLDGIVRRLRQVDRSA